MKPSKRNLEAMALALVKERNGPPKVSKYAAKRRAEGRATEAPGPVKWGDQ